jgi:hypothetical protein
MRSKVDDEDLAAGAEDSCSLKQCGSRIVQKMKHVMYGYKIHRLVRHR